ncbi:hypothetical protein [Streptomyces sp. NPDC005096]
MDIAGVVDEVGPATGTELRVGDPVMAMLLAHLWLVRGEAGHA